MRDPLLLPCLALAAGIWCHSQLPFSRIESSCALVASLIVALTALRSSRPALRWIAWSLTCLFLGTLTAVLHQPARTPTLAADPDEVLTFSGCIVEPPILSVDREQFTVALTPKARIRVTLLLGEDEQPPRLEYGQTVEWEGRARTPHNFGNPGAFDYVRYLSRQQIYWDTSIRPDVLRVNGTACGSPTWKRIFGIRQAALERIDQLYHSDPYAQGMMRAILLGDTSRIDKLWTEHFRNTGTYHALVISGLHVTVVAGALLFFLRILFLPEMVSLLLTAQVAWLYAVVSGCSAPAMRAAGGFTLYLVARFFFRRARPLNLLALIAGVYLLADPDQLFDPSFQLSFLSVAVLGSLAGPLLNRFLIPYAQAARTLADPERDDPRQPEIALWRIEWRLFAETVALLLRVPDRAVIRAIALLLRFLIWAAELVAISILMQIALALPMVYYFHRLSVTGATANVFVVPLMSGLVPVGFAALFTGWHWLGQLAFLLLDCSRAVVDWHIRFEPAWRIPDPPLWLALLFAAALVCWCASLYCRRHTLHWPLAVLMLFVLLWRHPFAPQHAAQTLEVTAIDVGQGDSILVAFPGGAHMLIDAGGIPTFGRLRKAKIEIGEDVVSSYLWNRGIRKLDVVVCTHTHEDHSGGLAAIFRNFHPDALWTGANSDSHDWLKLQEAAQQAGVRVRPMRAGSAFVYSGANLEILSPPPDYDPPATPKNNDSLAFRLEYGRHSFLLTGDMEKQMEERLLEDPRLRKVDVLKVGHHGSKTSSTEEFLERIQPGFAVISVGLDNRYKLPHPSVVERFAAHHTALYRTDQFGLVSFITDGKRLQAWPYRLLPPLGRMP